jgi:phosphate transport system substrate-binding protein
MFSILLYGVIVTSCSSAWSSGDGQRPPGSVSLSGGGSTFSSVLFNRWFAVYHDSHPNTFIKYASVSSGEGVRRFIGKDVAEQDNVDFGASDAAMSDAELAQTDNNTLMLPVTAGCVVLAYKLPLSWRPQAFAQGICRYFPRERNKLERSDHWRDQTRT